MKKRIACVCLLAALTQTAVFADVEKVKFSGNTCIVSGSVDEGENIGVLITNGGLTGGDMGKAVAFESFEAEKSGNFTKTLGMSEERINNAQELTVYVKVGDNERKEFVLGYISPAELSKLILKMKNAADEKELKKILDAAENETGLRALGFEMEMWNDSDKDNASLVFFNDKECLDKSPEEIEKSFMMSVLLSSYNAKNKSPEEITDMLDEISEIKALDISWLEIKKDEAEKKAVLSYVKNNSPFVSAESLNNEFGCGAVFYDLLNAGAYGTVRDILVKYNDVLGMEKQSYYSYFNSNRESVSKELMKLLASLKNTGISSQESFHKLMATAAENAKKGNSGESSSGGNSSGGGGGGGKNTSSSPIIAPIVKNEDVNSGASEQENSLFTDFGTGHWAYEAAANLYEKGIISGYEDGSFMPEKKVTREEFLTMLIKALDIATIGGTCPFEDVEYGKWYSSYVSTAYMKGLISGLDKNYFGLGEEITRQDIASILMRSRSEYNQENIREYKDFADSAEIAGYAGEAVRVMYEQGVISGSDGYFNPKSSASRAETAMMIFKFINLE